MAEGQVPEFRHAGHAHDHCARGPESHNRRPVGFLAMPLHQQRSGLARQPGHRHLLLHPNRHPGQRTGSRSARVGRVQRRGRRARSVSVDVAKRVQTLVRGGDAIQRGLKNLRGTDPTLAHRGGNLPGGGVGNGAGVHA